MISKLKSFFEEHLKVDPGVEPERREHAHHLACAALLIEMMRADFEEEAAERHAIEQAIGRAFALDDSETTALLSLAEGHADDATSLYEFTSLINQHLDAAEKIHFIELMWSVAWADGRVDQYEEHLVRHVAELIHVRHSEFIQAKLRAQPAA